MIRARVSLCIGIWLAASSHAQERLAAKDLSFFEYLGVMVEKDGAWVDPLDMENAELAKAESDAEAGETKEEERSDVQRSSVKEFSMVELQR